eukprot:g17880.t1
MVLGRAVTIPGHYAPRKYAFYGASVEVGEGPYGRTKFPEPPEEEEALLCLLDCRINVESPGQVVSYRHSEGLDGLHLLNLSSINVDGGVFSSFLSEVDDQFFSFADRDRLFSLPYVTKPSISLLYFDSLLLDIRST